MISNMNKQKYIFQIWLMVKIFIDIFGKIYYIGLIKNIKFYFNNRKTKDYILMNKYGDI